MPAFRPEGLQRRVLDVAAVRAVRFKGEVGRRGRGGLVVRVARPMLQKGEVGVRGVVLYDFARDGRSFPDLEAALRGHSGGEAAWGEREIVAQPKGEVWVQLVLDADALEGAGYYKRDAVRKFGALVEEFDGQR